MSPLKRYAAIFVFAIAAFAGSANDVAAKCSARFLNPFTEVCWDCIFPISIGGFKFFNERPDTSNPGVPFCLCANPFPRVGLSIGLWEPARLVDVETEPGCFVNLGFKLNLGLFDIGQGARKAGMGPYRSSSFHAHYYYYPLISWIGTVVDGLCLTDTTFDIAYVSELDPLWNNPELTTIINPEAVLFGGRVAQAACAADCVKASATGQAFDPLFWCDGCQGNMYPIQGQVNAHQGGIQASLNVATKLQFRMHRFLLARGTAGSKALCHTYPMPIMRKQQYRTQLTRPNAKTGGYYGCPGVGESTAFYESLREYPVKGESFGWLMWRKRNCCAL